MLVYDPEKRITIAEALQHPYMASLHYPDDEPTTDKVSGFDFDFEKYSLNTSEYKDVMYEEILLYHSDEAALEYIKMKETYPDGALHLRYTQKLRKAYK